MTQQTAARGARLAMAVLVLVASGAAVRASAQAIVSNGIVQLGINPEGHLNAPGGVPSSGTGTTVVGLRYVPTNGEFTAPGCLCEGWGAGDALTGVSGFANVAADGVRNLERVDFVSDERRAVCTTLIRDRSAAPLILVTHDYHPSAATPNLYEVTVTMRNVGAAAIDPRYRRVMDWDMEPTAFSEYVTIDGGTVPSALLFSSDDGFTTANPFGGPSQLLTLGPPSAGYFTRSGPYDHGALFDFGFGPAQGGKLLGPGDELAFNIYYGGAASETDALAAVAAVGAELWSFGEPMSSPDGTPNTGIFAFGAIGGDPFAGGDRRPPVFLNAFGPTSVGPGATTFTVRADLRDSGLDPVTGGTVRIAVGDGLAVTAPASFGVDLTPGVTVSRSFEVAAADTCAGIDSWFELSYDAALPDGTSLARTVHRALRIAGSCATLSGSVTGNGAPMVGARVDVCPVAGGACRSGKTDAGGAYVVDGIAPGRYDVRAFPAASFDAPPQDRLDQAFAGGVRMEFAFTHFDAPPSGSTISPARDYGMGVPVIYWGDVVTVTMEGEPGCSGEWVLVDEAGVAKRGDSLDLDGDGAPDGAMTESPPGHYTGRILPTPLSPPTIHGYFKVKTTLTCGDGTFAAVYDIYIDPSGTVRDVLGNPVEGATVTLLRADAPAGPFAAVTGGSEVMSFANRTNPMTTDAAGHFGWDVVAGYYKVRAEKSGCTDASGAPFTESVVLSIPPPVTGLDLRLACGVADGTPPVTSAAVAPTPNAAGWWRGPVDVTLDAADEPGGSGVASIAWTLSGAGAGAAVVPGAHAVVRVDAEGTSTLAFAATDAARNAEPARSVGLRIDSVAPAVSAAFSVAPNAAGWWRDSVDVTIAAADAGSGVASIALVATGAAPASRRVDGDRVVVPIAAEGVTVIRFTATDLAGNTSEGTATVRIDRTPPSLSCRAAPGLLWPPSHQLVPVKVDVASRDALSGGAGFELVSVASNEPDDGVGDGDTAGDVQGWTAGTPDVSGALRAERSGNGPGRTYTLRYAASDLAGNVATCATTVVVPRSR